MKESFIFYRSWLYATNNLPAEEFKTLYTAVIKYALDSIEPELTGSELMAFSFMKPLIDSNNEKWEVIRKKRSEAGKQGGAPTGNNNASKQNKHNKQLLEKQAKQAVNVNVNDTVNVNEYDDDNVPDEIDTSSSFFYLNIIEKAKKHGFNINETQAQKFINHLEPSWLAGEYSFIDFAIEKVKMSGKSEEDHIKLFVKFCEQDFLINEFPEWRTIKENEAAAEEKRHREKTEEQERQKLLNKAKENKPTTCNNCGAPVEFNNEWGYCTACNYRCFFDEETQVYVFEPQVNLSKMYKKMMAEKSNETQNEEIEF